MKGNGNDGRVVSCSVKLSACSACSGSRECIPKPAWPHAARNGIFILEPFSLAEDLRDTKREIADDDRNADLSSPVKILVNACRVLAF